MPLAILSGQHSTHVGRGGAPMVRPKEGPIMQAQDRTQTTVSVSKDALEALDELSRASGVSRSRLYDMAMRRFIRWAENVHPEALHQIAEYETEGRTVPYIRKVSSSYVAPGRSDQSEARLAPLENETASRPGLRKTKGHSETPVRVKRDR